MVEMVKQMVEKTKQEVKEEERKQEIMQRFEEIYGFKPDLIIWTDNLTLKAVCRINVEDWFDEEFTWFIEGKQILEVAFILKEEENVGHDIDWKLSRSKRTAINYYNWKRQYGQYLAEIEIITKN
jgi:hypothetical protein